MTFADSFLEIGAFLVVLLLSAPVLGAYIGNVCSDESTQAGWLPPLSSLEKGILKCLGREAQREMDWIEYTQAVLVFGLIGIILLTVLLLLQGYLPLNPQRLPGVPFWLALNTAVSFVTNTNWQAYSGESTLSYLSQALGLTTQNFISAATGIAVMVALARGLKRTQARELGNFWKDLTRATIYVLLPLAIIWAVLLVSQGVIQNFSGYLTASTLEGHHQVIPMGPAASQIAIKQVGTNGGGFFGVNSAHPFENPNPLSNFLELFAILMVPAALPFAFGRLVGHYRHGVALFAAMLILFLGALGFALWAEFHGNPTLNGLSFMEGKEQRFGIGTSVLWGMATTVASNGSVNSMLSSFSPVAGGLAMFNIMLGEVVFGGVGSGVYGMVLYVILTVFIAGLMVGRTPEYLGKKIEAPEVRMAIVGAILPGVIILVFSALALLFPQGLSSIQSKGPHGLSEVLYAFSSAAGNNGSAFAGLNANTAFYNGLLALTMFLGRYGVIIPALYIAGHLGAKKQVPASLGTFATDGGLFSILLCAIVIIIGALTFFPALSLGPIMEHVLMIQGRVL